MTGFKQWLTWHLKRFQGKDIKDFDYDALCKLTFRFGDLENAYDAGRKAGQEAKK